MNFDPRLTFDTFVVGPANRLASAAARRAAESPGTSYNPLFLYSASGLGKSHILNAIAHHARRPGRTGPVTRVVYETLEGYLETLTRALAAGGGGAGGEGYHDVDILLLDDVQFLTGQPQAQEMLLRTLDTLAIRGAQVVLASDRPPAEINGLDARLLSRFSGGLIVDIGLPDYETRVAILRRKAEDRGARLGEGVAEALGRHPFRNVRELQGALNRLFAVQELEERVVPLGELGAVLGEGFSAEGARRGENGATNAGASMESDGTTEGEATPLWRRTLQQVVEGVESAGFVAKRIRRLLLSRQEPPGWREALNRFRDDIDRLRVIRERIEALPTPWPEEAEAVLRDPDLLDEAERVLAMSEERARPFPPLPPGPGLEGEGSRFPSLACRAAERALVSESGEYNPLFVHAHAPTRSRDFLVACGNTLLERNPRARIGLVSVPEFSEGFIAALSTGVAGAWRERWWSLDLLLVGRIEDLGVTERAQEEFFHLFEALKRRGARIFLAADRPAAALQGIDERLRSRFQGGLVLDLGAEPSPPAAGIHPRSTDGSVPDPRDGEVEGNRAEAERTASDILRELDGALAAGRASPLPGGDTGPSSREGVVSSVAASAAPAPPLPDAEASPGSPEPAAVWMPPSDRVVWRWPRIEDRISEPVA